MKLGSIHIMVVPSHFAPWTYCNNATQLYPPHILACQVQAKSFHSKNSSSSIPFDLSPTLTRKNCIEVQSSQHYESSSSLQHLTLYFIKALKHRLMICSQPL